MPAISLTDQLFDVRTCLARARAAGDRVAVDRLGEQQFRIERELAWESGVVAPSGHNAPVNRTGMLPLA
ncbi:hypothetical protein [Rhodococcus jostii]|uniref:hypothetical protein n=1 Tax=Rhodococcus jostii TaxID=132919 RepID=UPI00363468D0